VPDIGNTLREARIRKGLTISDVETVTKIRSKYLEALEENDFEVLPGPTVVKGFLRSYAVFLKLDPEELLAEYRNQYEYHREDIGALRTELSQQRRTPTSAERKKKRNRRTQRGYVAAGLIAVILIILLAWLTSGGRGQGPATIDASNLPSSTTTLPTTQTVAVAAESTSTSSTTTSEHTSTTASENTSTTVHAPATTGENVKMVLSVSEGSCWLVVREDSESGAELYAGTLSAGGRQTFENAKQYWMMAGAPEALTVSVNGTPFSLSGGAGTFVVTESGVERIEQQAE
jgi:cytoskeleton protein RodZ